MQARKQPGLKPIWEPVTTNDETPPMYWTPHSLEAQGLKVDQEQKQGQHQQNCGASLRFLDPGGWGFKGAKWRA
jgi:hypothetical protein